MRIPVLTVLDLFEGSMLIHVSCGLSGVVRTPVSHPSHDDDMRAHICGFAYRVGDHIGLPFT